MNASVSDARASRGRVLPLRGGCNFRDIGGYATTHGTSVRWGRVYRAGVLSYFTDEDHGSLRDLQVRAICDLRRADERVREPTRWPAPDVHCAPALLHWDDGDDVPTIRCLAAERPNTAAGMFDAMIELYRVLPQWMSGRIRGLFECIEHGRVPMVVHCAAGKDRTGVAIAVLLCALGVRRESAIEDYLLTNEAGDFETFIRARQQVQLGLTDTHRPLLAMPEDVRRVLFSAHPQFLQSAFDEIDRSFGGLDAYLERTVRVSAASRAAVVRALVS